MSEELSNFEAEMLVTLPQPPQFATARTNELLIVECLGPDERKTGHELWQWAESKRVGWAKYHLCSDKTELFDLLARVSDGALNSVRFPILHLEAHGDADGLYWTEFSGPSVRWEELTGHLQVLNEAIKCNLMIAVSACIGIAGMKAISMGPRAPAIAIIGPCSNAMPSELLAGFKKFYRRLIRGDGMLHEYAASASNEVGDVSFAVQPLTVLAWETFMSKLVVETRPWRKTSGGVLPNRRHARRLTKIFEEMWAEMFMFDLFPENAGRFQLDIRRAVTELTT